MEENKSVFDILNDINVNGHTEEKNGLTYLSWAWAWGELKKHYPDALYKIERFGEEKKPYLYDDQLGYMVFTSMTINGQTHEMWLPVMDGANKTMMKAPYEYLVNNKNHRYAKLNKEDGKYYDQYGNEQPKFFVKKVEKATMFDINKTIMRCLVKNISMFGLGLYIYAGEDLPESDKKATAEQIDIITKIYTGENMKKLLEKNNISRIEDMTKEKATELINKLPKKENQNV